jgi:hypothetical protein
MGNPVAGRALAARSWRRTPELNLPGGLGDIRAATIRYLAYVPLPAWSVPGVAGYVLHRRTRIERAAEPAGNS